MTRPVVSLVMIVKNEAHVIRRCLDSVRPLVDRWLIVDTGSTDGTQDVVRAHLAGLPGELVERPWVGFGPNRTEALQLAAPHADFLFTMDADDVMTFAEGWQRPGLEADAYEVEIRHDEVIHRRLALVRAALPWRYEGVLHEYLACDRPYTTDVLPGARMLIVGGGARSRDGAQAKALRDAATLEAALQREPGNTRYAFYLARTWLDAGKHDAALAAFDRRSVMGGFDQEVYLSMLSGARLAARLGRPYAEVINRFLRAWDFRPMRHEAVGEWLAYLRGAGPRWQLAYRLGREAVAMPPSDDALFVEPEWHAWRCLDEFAIAAYWSGHAEESRDACERLLAGSALPAAQRARVQANLDFALARLATGSV